ncbi:MAG: energy-coupling factor transporter ATPase, partial [Clostridium butyricum]|nr:energy-coupling factor transporter ATPase [Clostridium butyricum]
MEDVANIAEKVIVMNHGKVALEGTPAEVFKEVDKLESIGLAVPQVTYLIRNLRAKGFDISDSIFTIEEAKRAILSIFASNSTKGDK